MAALVQHRRQEETKAYELRDDLRGIAQEHLDGRKDESGCDRMRGDDQQRDQRNRQSGNRQLQAQREQDREHHDETSQIVDRGAGHAREHEIGMRNRDLADHRSVFRQGRCPAQDCVREQLPGPESEREEGGIRQSVGAGAIRQQLGEHQREDRELQQRLQEPP